MRILYTINAINGRKINGTQFGVYFHQRELTCTGELFNEDGSLSVSTNVEFVRFRISLKQSFTPTGLLISKYVPIK